MYLPSRHIPESHREGFGTGWFLCHGDLLNFVDLPNDIADAEVVFSSERSDDSYSMFTAAVCNPDSGRIHYEQQWHNIDITPDFFKAINDACRALSKKTVFVSLEY